MTVLLMIAQLYMDIGDKTLKNVGLYAIKKDDSQTFLHKTVSNFEGSWIQGCTLMLD